MQRLENILAQTAASKVSEWASYGNYRKVTLKPAFSGKVQRGDQGKFFKHRLKSSLRLKFSRAFWRKSHHPLTTKWHYPLISMHLKCKDWRRFWGKKAAPKVPEWPSYGKFRKVTQNPHFPEKRKRGTKENV